MIQSKGRWTATGLLIVATLGCAGGASTRTPSGPAGAGDELRTRKAEILRAEDRRLVDRPLLDALADERPELRALAVRALGRIGDATRAADVAQALADSDPGVRSAAAFAFGLLGAPDGIAPLLGLADDANAGVRGAVADALGLLGRSESRDALLALLGDTQVSVAASACYATAGFPEAGFAVEPLIRMTERSEPEVLLACTWALSELARSTGKIELSARVRARDRMIELTKSQYSELRRLAAAGLNIPSREAEAASLGPLCEDPVYSVRIEAIASLSFPGAPIEPFLSKVFDDEDERVFLALVDGLGRMRGDDIVEMLARIVVHDPRLWVRERAVLALGRSSNLSAQMANGLSRAEEVEIRRATGPLLVGRLDDETIAYATRLLADGDPLVRAAVVPAFAGYDAPLSSSLADVLDDQGVVRAAAARAAGARLADARATAETRRDAMELLTRLWEGAQEQPDAEVGVEIMRAAGQAPADTEGARALLVGGVAAESSRVRGVAIAQLRRVYGEDRSAEAGAAVERPLDDYLEIVRWAERPRAAIVTVQRPGFVPGRFTVRLDTVTAPLGAWSFARLAGQGVYDDLPVYRVVPGIAAYSGDPREAGRQAPEWILRDEPGASRFAAGTVAMGSPGGDRPGGAWFVTQSLRPTWMVRYTAIGSVVQNMAGVAARLLPLDRVVSVAVYEGDGTEPLPPLPE